MYLIYNLISAHLPSVERGNGVVLVAALECSHRIVVSTQDFHSCNTSSILVGSTKDTLYKYVFDDAKIIDVVIISVIRCF